MQQLVRASRGGVALEIVVGDITRLPVGAIVNAANGSLLGGGGVDGAIHRAAGPALRQACRPLGGCAVGEAKVTPGFALPAGFVIHTVGPVWRGGGTGERALLAACYRASLALAGREHITSIAFPAISTGAYGFPAGPAARIAVGSVLSALETARNGPISQVIFCCFSAESAILHHDAFNAHGLLP